MDFEKIVCNTEEAKTPTNRAEHRSTKEGQPLETELSIGTKFNEVKAISEYSYKPASSNHIYNDISE